MTDPILTVQFEALGRDETRIKSWRCNSHFLQSTDDFEFMIKTKDPAESLGLEMQPVQLLLSTETVTGAQIALGRVDLTEIGNDGTAVTCRGRDYMADLVECGLDPEFQVTANTSLARAFGDAMAPCGITTVIGTGDELLRNIRTGRTPTGTAPPKDFETVKLEELKPQPGLGVYEWCNRTAARNGATIQPWEDRQTVCLAQPDYAQAPLYTLRRTTDSALSKSNNLISGIASRDYSQFPTHALITGKPSSKAGKPGRLDQAYDILDVARELGSAELYDTLERAIVPGRRKPADSDAIDGGRLYRLLWQQDKEAKNAEQILSLGVRAIAERLKPSLIYRCRVKGFHDRDTGALYATNCVADVQDEICGVQEPMWIASRTFEFNPNQGAETGMELWRLGSFQVGAS